MKKVTNRVCTKVPGCPAFSCSDADCLGKKLEQHKPEAVPGGVAELHRHDWYNGKRWKLIRAGQLAREPLCQRCLSFGIVTPGAHVDHVIAHAGDASLFFDKTNLQTLCGSCHTFKTNAERAGEVLDYRSGS